MLKYSEMAKCVSMNVCMGNFFSELLSGNAENAREDSFLFSSPYNVILDRFLYYLFLEYFLCKGIPLPL